MIASRGTVYYTLYIKIVRVILITTHVFIFPDLIPLGQTLATIPSNGKVGV